jgi:hypothetical protein
MAESTFSFQGGNHHHHHHHTSTTPLTKFLLVFILKESSSGRAEAAVAGVNRKKITLTTLTRIPLPSSHQAED